jgi:hypothetical protein
VAEDLPETTGGPMKAMIKEVAGYLLEANSSISFEGLRNPTDVTPQAGMP